MWDLGWGDYWSGRMRNRGKTFVFWVGGGGGLRQDGGVMMERGLLEVLSRSELLTGTAAGAAGRLFESGRVRRGSGGDVVFEEGAQGAGLLVVLEGVIDLVRVGDEGEHVLASLGAGAVVGEMAILEEQPRSATARVVEPGATWLEVDRDVLQGFVAEYPQLMWELGRRLSARLRMGNEQLMRRLEELERAHRRLEVSYQEILRVLTGALDLRDQETEGHSQRVTAYSLAIAREMGLGEVVLADLRLGAILHDIGKIGVSDGILRKQGGLTEAEWAEMRRHPEMGAGLIRGVASLSGGVDVVASHHERWDGSGYPRGLSGGQIPLTARVFAVADVYDALTSKRSYKDAWESGVAREEIRQKAGTQFDPQVVAAFERAFEAIEVIRQTAFRPRE